MIASVIKIRGGRQRDHSDIFTRRDFLKSTAAAAVGAFVPILDARSNSQSSSVAVNGTTSEILTTGWEYFRGSLGSAWDVWRADIAESTGWKKIDVPHCFNAHDAVDPDQPYYEGPAWYRRKLQPRNPFENGRILLLFEGVGQKSQIFIANERVGTHVGGYDEFVVDITDVVARELKNSPVGGDIPLAVFCDNSRDSETIPSALNDFHRFGGLYRDVTLIYAPAISLERIHMVVEMSRSASAQVTVKARLQNPASSHDEVQLLIRIFDPKGSLVRTASRKQSAWEGEVAITNFNFDNPHLWSPTDPALYRCEVQLASVHGTMSAVERFGFRYFEFVDHGPFKLNGEQLYLKGTHREEDHAGLGAAMPESLIRQEMTLIKDMGANFVGLAHHQQSRTVLDLCDELGLLVLEEIPWSRGGMGGEDYKAQARNMLRAMIDQHYNHPSIILWGVGNENDWPGDFPEFDKQAIRGFMKELNDEVHALDPGRKTFLRRCDFCKDLVYVYSPSLWAGWYHGPYTQFRAKAEHEMNTVSHFLHVEWGAESHAGRHSEDVDRPLAHFVSGKFDENEREHLLNGGEMMASREGDWSETYACNLFDWHLKEQQNLPQLTGSAQWIFKDFSTPLRPDNPLPHVNQKGLTQRDLTLKEGYYVFQSYWSEKPMVHIYGRSWPVRWGTPDELKLLKVYSNCEMAELFLNGVSLGMRKRNSQDFPAAGLHWLTKFQIGQNHLRVFGHKGGMTVEDDVVLRYQHEEWGPAQHIELQEIGHKGEKVYVQARLLDANGQQCLNARDRVRFGLTGDGVLLDNLGTTTGSRCVELCNGRAEISLLTNRGKSVISAHVQPIPTAFLTVS
jgi:beta-galactosidase